MVVVKNIGGTKTPATELLFRFSDTPSTSPNYLPGLMNVGPLNPGQQQTVVAHPLPRAWVPNSNGNGARLYFRVEADWKKEIFELKENNNKAKGNCIGPLPD
ncbi:CARDB domain-containing protein [Halovulum sp. GXIMD14793]